MNAREQILGNLRARRLHAADTAPPYTPPVLPDDKAATFAERAARADAVVQRLQTADEIPAAVAALLRERNLAASIHLPPDAVLGAMDWGTLEIRREPPGPDDAAIATAPFGVAETGTLAYPARADSPASWHYRPGFEIAILRERDIVGSIEDVLRVLKGRELPYNINFVTGPSRTADIEQTLELGAHGPKALAILLIRD